MPFHQSINPTRSVQMGLTHEMSPVQTKDLPQDKFFGTIQKILTMETQKLLFIYSEWTELNWIAWWKRGFWFHWSTGPVQKMHGHWLSHCFYCTARLRDILACQKPPSVLDLFLSGSNQASWSYFIPSLIPEATHSEPFGFFVFF